MDLRRRRLIGYLGDPTQYGREILDVDGVADDDKTLDAFHRRRVSPPHSVFDSKLLFDKSPLLWDESLVSGADISSVHSTDKANVVLTSTALTAGRFVRQTFMRFNYQPGKGQHVAMTGIIGLGGGATGVERRLGLFDDDNGLFFQESEGVVSVNIRSRFTGSPVTLSVPQSLWNIDKLNGEGVSGVIAKWQKGQIFFMDFQWLGIGDVWFGLVIDGIPRVVHHFLHTNIKGGVYMSTPNLPLRYELITTSASPARSLVQVCATVVSDGGVEDNGHLHYHSTGATNIEVNSVGTLYAIVGLRLKSAHIGASIKLKSVTLINTTGDDYEWLLIKNPDVATPVTWSDGTGSAQVSVGNTGNPSTSTLTNGDIMDGGYVKSSGFAGSVTALASNAILLGSAIDGTRDEIYLAARPLTANANILGGITRRDLV